MADAPNKPSRAPSLRRVAGWASRTQASRVSVRTQPCGEGLGDADCMLLLASRHSKDALGHLVHLHCVPFTGTYMGTCYSCHALPCAAHDSRLWTLDSGRQTPCRPQTTPPRSPHFPPARAGKANHECPLNTTNLLQMGLICRNVSMHLGCGMALVP